MAENRRHIARATIYKYNRIFCWLLLVVFILTAMTIGLYQLYSPQKIEINSDGNFSINGFYCKVPEFIPTPMKHLKVHRAKLNHCNNIAFLTSIKSPNSFKDPLSIKIHSEAFVNYKVSHATCCYHVLTRKSNEDIDVSPKCIEFEDGHVISKKIQLILVKCSSGGKEFYKNAHAVVSRTEELHKRMQKIKKQKKKTYKVLMVGINSMSRMNLIRGMPKSYELLDEKNNWFEMKGYTRIAEDSFSNLFAILTGHSPDQKLFNCDPSPHNYLDDCNFIWKEFEKAGYVTTFAEDQLNLSSFHLKHKGFRKQPTDFYFHPFVVAAEKLLEIRKKDNLAFCLGHSLYIDEIFVYALKLISIHDTDPFFGVFYVNSLKDKQLVSSPIMDSRISDSFLKQIDLLDMKDTIVIYFGHSGTRFEESLAGFYEERNPFLFLRLPEEFQKSFPKFVKHLKSNANRLTTPYDLHVTLRHILDLSTEEKIPKKAVGCRQCQSLFEDISNLRSCSDVHIDAESCPCSLEEFNPIPPIVELAAQFAVDVLNEKVSSLIAAGEGDCVKFKLHKVISAYHQLTSRWNMNFLIRFEVSPSEAQFEAHIAEKSSSLFGTPKFKLLNEIFHTNPGGALNICFSKSGIQVGRRNEVEENYDEDDLWVWD